MNSNAGVQIQDHDESGEASVQNRDGTPKEQQGHIANTTQTPKTSSSQLDVGDSIMFLLTTRH